jgi:hypothetical protein
MKMENELPLILAVADLAYSGGETFQIFQLALQWKGFKADLQTVPLAEVIQTVAQRKPALVIIGQRPLLDDDDMRERWSRLGRPMDGDLVMPSCRRADQGNICSVWSRPTWRAVDRLPRANSEAVGA